MGLGCLISFFNLVAFSRSPSLSGDPALAVLGSKKQVTTMELSKRPEQPTVYSYLCRIWGGNIL